jgi:conjugal transfer pilin signal peptidase TrbI
MMRYLCSIPGFVLRVHTEHFMRTLHAHLQRWRRTYVSVLLLSLAVGLFKSCFAIGLNATQSLPHTLYLIHKGAPVERGQYVAFHWQGGGPYPAGLTFVKILAGMPGDMVTQREREYFVNGVAAGKAKRLSNKGAPLHAGPTGVIPPGQYYVTAPHPDSLDSRYWLTGWIPHKQIIGRAYALF